MKAGISQDYFEGGRKGEVFVTVRGDVRRGNLITSPFIEIFTMRVS